MNTQKKTSKPVREGNDQNHTKAPQKKSKGTEKKNFNREKQKAHTDTKFKGRHYKKNYLTKMAEPADHKIKQSRGGGGEAANVQSEITLKRPLVATTYYNSKFIISMVLFFGFSIALFELLSLSFSSLIETLVQRYSPMYVRTSPSKH